MRRLAAAEAEHDVRILLAVESGSRAWDSPRRIATMTCASSTRIGPTGIFIEYPIVDDIDLNGWDVRKALRLFRKSNPAFVEWVQSPILW